VLPSKSKNVYKPKKKSSKNIINAMYFSFKDSLFTILSIKSPLLYSIKEFVILYIFRIFYCIIFSWCYNTVVMKSGEIMDNIRIDLNRLPKLIVGFIIMSTGIAFIQMSSLGLFPWGVLHDGLHVQTGLSFGEVTQILGLIVLVFSMVAFKTNLGPGTLLNILLVGWMIDKIGSFMTYQPESIIVKILVFTVGLLLISLGRAFYISSRLGAGPRDGMFVGLSRITQVDVKYVKPAIEIIVLTVGAILGGEVGIGTIVLMLSSGYFVQVFFKLFNYDPKTERQRSFTEYIKTKQKDTV